jgi:hypothetical protein
MGLDGLAWVPVRVAGSVGARSSHGFATNGRDVAVLFGGMASDDDGEPLPLADLFHLTFEPRLSWKQVHATGDKPSQREGHTLNFLSSTSVFYLFGGSDDQSGTEFNDLFTYDPSGTSWRKCSLHDVFESRAYFVSFIVLQ